LRLNRPVSSSSNPGRLPIRYVLTGMPAGSPLLGVPPATEATRKPGGNGAKMIRRLRLLSGLALLAYVTMHLANHALGLVSLDAMEQALDWIAGLWSLYPMLALLYGAFLVHYTLGLWSVWERRILRLRASELVQLVLGFALPILLVRHVAANRIATTAAI
jgi:adenylate cyclase